MKCFSSIRRCTLDVQRSAFAVLLLLVLLAAVVCHPSSVRAGPIEIPSVSVASLTGDVATIKSATNAINIRVGTAEATLSTATGAVAVIQARTSTWTQASTDASSWTNAQATALKSVTNSWTDTNGIPWYVVLSANGMITHWSTNAP